MIYIDLAVFSYQNIKIQTGRISTSNHEWYSILLTGNRVWIFVTKYIIEVFRKIVSSLTIFLSIFFWSTLWLKYRELLLLWVIVEENTSDDVSLSHLRNGKCEFDLSTQFVWLEWNMSFAFGCLFSLVKFRCWLVKKLYGDEYKPSLHPRPNRVSFVEC